MSLTWSCPFVSSIACIFFMPAVLSLSQVRPNPYAQEARDILDASGVKGGLVVHVGCREGKLTAALLTDDSYLIHGLDRDPAAVEKARQHLRTLGLYGKVSIDRLRGDTLPYADNLVNLLVLESAGDIPVAEVTRVLCPQGVACARSGGTWTVMVKARSPAIDEWTHYLHDATGNAVARDSVVGPPRRYQWIGSPRWSRHHDRMASVSACVSAGGRILYILDEGSRMSIQLPSQWSLVARDAFNGTILWKRPISSWVTQYWPFKSGPAQLPRRLVAAGEKVYVTLGLDGTGLSMLDAATGRTLRTYDATAMTEELIYSDGVLFLMVKDNPPATGWNQYRPIHRTIGNAKSRVADEWPWDEADRRLVTLDAETGQVLWQKAYPIAPLTLAADTGAVFFHDGERIISLDRLTGGELWRSSEVARRSPMPANFGPTLVVYGDMVLFAGGNASRTLAVLSARSGETLWTSSYAPSGHNCPHDLLVIDDLAWAGATAGGGHSGIFKGWDLHSGAVVREFAPDVDIYWFHHRCYRARGVDKYILTSRTGVEFIDSRAEHWIPHHWVRGGCLYGIMPCNGLLYAPPHNCACYAEAKLSGFSALAPAHPDSRYPQPLPDGSRLEPGPAYGDSPSAPAESEAWPTYRADAERSGYTPSVVPADMKLSWQTALGGRLTSPVIAGGRVYVASIEMHTVFALSEDNGAVLWSRTVGGRVDSPPTYYRGKLLFGSADGWVYCLRASDGELVWRFQAAPLDLRLAAFEQLESVWPVSGSVLVMNDSVHCVAGRSVFLDGGLRLVRLDPETGRKLSEVVLDDRDPQTLGDLQTHVKGLNMPVGLPDILSSDGRRIFMRSQQFDLEGNRLRTAPYSGNHTEQASQQQGQGAHLFCPFGFLDDTWFHRSYWVYGRTYASGAGGYYRAGWFAPAGRILVFDKSRLYGFGREPQYYKWTTPMEHHLFATDKEAPPTDAQAVGISQIEVAKSESLNPAGKPLVVEAWVQAERSDGVILARGGGSHGYALALERGRPLFAVRVDGQVNSVGAKEEFVGKWVHLTGVLTADQQLQIYLNGALSASSQAAGFIVVDPCQAMQIGADEGSAVGDYGSPSAFTGVVDEVRIYHGTLSPAEIMQHVSMPGPVQAESADLVLCYSFDLGDADDESGHGNHGQVNGARSVPGKFGNAMKFVGSVTSGTQSRLTYHWSHNIPLFARAMVLADKTLFVAGPEDVIDEEQVFDYWATALADPGTGSDILAKIAQQDAILRGQQGALLWAVCTASGRRLAQYELESIPVWDGMAAANGRLYMCLENGNVQSFVGTNYPPTVDAGADQIIYPMARAMLDAAVADDGLPRTDPCDPQSPSMGVTSSWSTAGGPGQVIFDDPCSVDTAASFSHPGEYTLRLTATDGSTPGYDDVQIIVSRYGDLDLDHDVDRLDMSRLVTQWLSARCDSSNDWCVGADQTADGTVDFRDYAVTSRHWLDGVHPSAPVGLTVVGGPSSVSLDWDDNTETDIAGYHVYRSVTSDSGYARINPSLLTDSAYVDIFTVSYRTYCYYVSATDILGYPSVGSGIVSASSGIQPVLKLRADLGVSQEGSKVRDWQDQAGNHNAVQSVPEERPQRVGSGIGSWPAIKFDGVDDNLYVADSDGINVGGPYTGKTLAIVFKTGEDTASRQIIWEQGGGVRGLSFYLDDGNLYINGWNLQETSWGPTGVSTVVSPHTVYVATLVLDADSGTFEGFVNGKRVGIVSGVGQLYNHSNDCAFGHLEGATVFHDGSKEGPANFSGWIAEFHEYNEALPVYDRRGLERALMVTYGTYRGR